MAAIGTLSPTLTTPSTCMTSTDIWQWLLPNSGHYGVLGPPGVTSTCMPSSYHPSGYYIGERCPAGYTSACNDLLGGVNVIRCCPTAYYFLCENLSATTRSAMISDLLCSSHFDTKTWQITVTDFVSSSLWTTVTTNFGALHAYAIEVASMSGSSATSSTSTTTPTNISLQTTSSPHTTASTTGSGSTDGLSAGAKAGIGIGSGIAGLAIVGAILFYLIAKKRREKRLVAIGSHGETKIQEWSKPELDSGPVGVARNISELYASNDRFELPTNNDRLELPASNNRPELPADH